MSYQDRNIVLYLQYLFFSISQVYTIYMHTHPYNNHSSDLHCYLRTDSQIQSLYQGQRPKINLFERLLEENSQSQSVYLDPTAKNSQNCRSTQLTNLDKAQNQHRCKCSKIGCLKLYCECFAKGRQCNQKCLCSCCHNRTGNQEEIYKAKMQANLRHTNHFQGIPAMTPIRKCTCKKSMCIKKYCECFNSGVECTEFCQCKNCQNGHPHKDNSQKNQSLTVHSSIEVGDC